MNRTIGTCGACGGRVALSEYWLSTVPPVPTCEACGRQAARPWGPVVEMAREASRPAPATGHWPHDWAIDCPAVQGEAKERLQAFLRQGHGQGGDVDGGRKETSLRISGPTNSTRFTKCCGAAVAGVGSECPACGARVVGGGAPGREGA